MVETYGLTHIALAVSDINCSFEFYRQVFGIVEVYRGEDFIQAQTPGTRDVLVFQQRDRAIDSAGILHFGFRLKHPEDISAALQAIKEAGGRAIRHGEFCPGEPYVFFTDPDGYEVEIWHELPTPVDPRAET